jgi:aminoglycoside 3-N-acetyltransferase
MLDRILSSTKRLAKHFLPTSVQRSLRTGRSGLRRPYRAMRRRFSSKVDAGTLEKDLAGAGITRGDIVVVHASLSRIGNVSGGAEAVIRALQAAVGSEGTVLMPTFSDAETVVRDASHGRIVDLAAEPSLTGKVTEVFRTTPGTLRSSHPFSSLSASGAMAHYLTTGHAADPRIAHASSPLGRLLELNGKILGLGVDMGPVSFYHVLEDTWSGFPLNVYLPPEELTYLDANGDRVSRPVARYNPNVSRTRIDQSGSRWLRECMAIHLQSRGVIRPFTFGEAVSWVINARPLYDELKCLASEGVTIYSTADNLMAQRVFAND